MPRAPRRSFPHVHSLYLSREQDGRLRRFAERTDQTVSEVMRKALASYLDQNALSPGRRANRTNDVEPTRAETRDAIAAAARARKESRPLKNGPVLEGQCVDAGTPIWQPPRKWQEPADDDKPYPLAVDANGVSFVPLPNAVAWLVAYKRRAQDAPVSLIWDDNERVLLVPLSTTRTQLIRLVGQRYRWLVLHPIDSHGRLLRAKQGVVASRH